MRLVVRWGLMACRLLGGKIDKHLAPPCRNPPATRNAWPKDYIGVEREGRNRRLVRRESANDARLRTQMGKIGSGGVKIKFMELRPSMCRWPIGDPKHIETFRRFCMLSLGHLLQSAQRKSARPKSSEDAMFD